MDMLNELDMVVLTEDVLDHGLTSGDVGTIVHRYSDGKAHEVEFVTGEGTTVAVLTLNASQVRPIQQREILHVRELAA